MISLQLYPTFIHLHVAAPHSHTFSRLYRCTTHSCIFMSLHLTLDMHTSLWLYSCTTHPYIFTSLQLHHTFIHLYAFPVAPQIHTSSDLYSCTIHPYIFTSLQLRHTSIHLHVFTAAPQRKRSANNYHVKCTQWTCSLLFQLKIPCQFLLHWACAGSAHARCH